MSFDKTQQQSPEELANSQAQSLSSDRPPAEVEGYALVRSLGAGAFGEVWLAIAETTRRKVAIKFYNRRSLADVRGLAKEVEKLVALSADRYVVQLYDVGWDANPPFYVMDFIERGSLEDLLRAEGKLPVNEALEIFQETAIGLMHLHGKGVLHCDLKPGNVLLDDDNKPRLADFGQSRMSSEATPSLGTLFYMAPEQADLEAIPDAKWDVYALGALFYVMLTGRPPYYDSTLTTQLETTADIRTRLDSYRRGIMQAAPPSAHKNVRGLDRALIEIIDRCIARDPKKRYSSVQSVLLALRQRSEAINRRPMLFLGLVGPLLLLVVLLVFGWNVYRQAVVDSDQALTSKAIESNRFAAKFAARSAAEQIDGYFREIQDLAQRREFRQALLDLLADPNLSKLRQQLSDPNRNNDDTLRFIRTEFLAAPVRERVQALLQRNHDDRKLPHVASWWVYDLAGNQVAGVFSVDQKDSDQRINTVGRNYSFRTYFSGLPEDLVDNRPAAPRQFPVNPDPQSRQYITQPHISSVFVSEQSGTWKIAFSTPILVDQVIVGLVGLTVEMGDFIDFDPGLNQYALMFDRRPGPLQGVVLEHPLFPEMVREGTLVSSEATRYRAELESLAAVPCRDPLHSITKNPAYRSQKIAATESIMFGDDAPERRDSGLVVAVLEDYATVIQPSHDLGARLFRMALWASGVLLAVAVGMWIFVTRTFQESRRRLSRTFTGTSDLDSTYYTYSSHSNGRTRSGVGGNSGAKGGGLGPTDIGLTLPRENGPTDRE